MKRWIPGAAALAALAALAAGCNKPAANNAGTGAKTMNIGIVLDKGGVNDQSFNASAWRGAQRTEKELGVEAKYAESQQDSDYPRNLRNYAKQNFDVIFAIGYLEQDAYDLVSKEYPDTKFVIIDGKSAGTPNAAGITFREEEGSFLVGALSALMSKSGTIGFIGGMHSPVITRFESGYKAGAKMARPDIKVLTQYTGSWEDSGKGQSMAQMQFSQGADIIFHAAGKSGLGVINAVKTQPGGTYVVGVDSDQDHLVEGKVLTSMVKNVDNAVFEFTKSVKDGAFKPGDQSYGLKEGGVGLSEMKYTKDKVTPEIMAKVDAYKEQIIAGDIDPPGTDAELAAFYQKNNLKP